MEHIRVERDWGPVAVVTVDRPKRRNALNLAMWRALGETFARLGADAGVRVVVFTGAGGHFSAGADIKEFADLRADAAQGLVYDKITDGCTEALMALTKPTIAAVDGYCLGGGCGLALACDFRVAGPTAAFGIPAARLGIVYGLVETRNLRNAVGHAKAKEILFSGARIDAAEAYRIGLADRLAEGPALEAALAFAETMAASAPRTVAGAKLATELLSHTDDPDGEAALDRLAAEAFDSEDYAEGRRAFAEKRPPAFTGR